VEPCGAIPRKCLFHFILPNEFWALTQNQWKIFPKIGYRRLIDGTVDFNEFGEILAHYKLIKLPVRIQEER
jgi:hypothetical protein